jgi:hypothetical protein
MNSCSSTKRLSSHEQGVGFDKARAAWTTKGSRFFIASQQLGCDKAGAVTQDRAVDKASFQLVTSALLAAGSLRRQRTASSTIRTPPPSTTPNNDMSAIATVSVGVTPRIYAWRAFIQIDFAARSKTVAAPACALDRASVFTRGNFAATTLGSARCRGSMAAQRIPPCRRDAI